MIDQLIEKYYRGECSEAEKSRLVQYFRENASEIDHFFSEPEWETMKNDQLNKTERTEMFLDRVIAEDSIPVKKPLLRKWLVAASISVLVGLTAAYFFGTTGSGHEDKSVKLLVERTNETGAPAGTLPNTVIRKNEQDTSVTCYLPDGSAVLLSPHSEIRYTASFNSNKRDIDLEGEAVFQVAKDTHRPFTVYCKEVATTALGTRFKVSALKGKEHVSVILLEGKIVVRGTAVAYHGNRYYLLPGNEIVYNSKNRTFSFNTDIMPPVKMAIIRPDNNENAAADEHIQVNHEQKFIHFNDVGMARVLAIMARKYGVSIAYPTDRINDIRFVGTIKENEPIQKILSDITSMNNLELIADTLHKKYTIR